MQPVKIKSKFIVLKVAELHTLAENSRRNAQEITLGASNDQERQPEENMSNNMAPTGVLTMTITNEKMLGQFVPGFAYFITIEVVPPKPSTIK